MIVEIDWRSLFVMSVFAVARVCVYECVCVCESADAPTL